jgi:hypothetical protein
MYTCMMESLIYSPLPEMGCVVPARTVWGSSVGGGRAYSWG